MPRLPAQGIGGLAVAVVSHSHRVSFPHCLSLKGWTTGLTSFLVGLLQEKG